MLPSTTNQPYSQIQTSSIEETPTTPVPSSEFELDAVENEEQLMPKRPAKFLQTVYAVQNIVETKSYKQHNNSLEGYFKKIWRMSRAQVYRYLDCAQIIKQLEGFPLLPQRERICRTIKRLAKSPEHVRALWAKVLDAVDHHLESITSTVIENAFHELKKSGVIAGYDIAQKNQAKTPPSNGEEQPKKKGRPSKKLKKSKSSEYQSIAPSQEWSPPKDFPAYEGSSSYIWKPLSSDDINSSNVWVLPRGYSSLESPNLCSELSSPFPSERRDSTISVPFSTTESNASQVILNRRMSAPENLSLFGFPGNRSFSFSDAPLSRQSSFDALTQVAERERIRLNSSDMNLLSLSEFNEDVPLTSDSSNVISTEAERILKEAAHFAEQEISSKLNEESATAKTLVQFQQEEKNHKL